MRKDLIITAFCTFCLTIALFSLIPRSNSPAVGEYDPWLDYDDNGRIDMNDIYYSAKAFGKFGDSTKNITIAGRINKLAYSVRGQPIGANGQGIGTPLIDVDGYSKVTICVALAVPRNDSVYSLWAADNATKLEFLVDEVNYWPHMTLVKTYDVPNQLIRIYLVSWDVVDRSYDLDVYLIP